MKIKTLYHTKWFSLKSMSDLSRGVKDYIFGHEECCNGKKLAILPFRKSGKSYEVLIKNDINPPWGMDRKTQSLTGGVESYPLEDAVKELDEETGYRVDENEMIFLGTCWGYKTADTIYYLYTIDLTGKPQYKAKGDGMEFPHESFWTSKIFSKDPLVYVLHYKLAEYLKRK